jgi:hypothetical protein
MDQDVVDRALKHREEEAKIQFNHLKNCLKLNLRLGLVDRDNNQVDVVQA